MAIFKFQLLLALSATLTSVFSTAAGQEIRGGDYFITGTIKGVDSGSVRMLSRDGNNVLDSADIKNGLFFMQGTIDMPERLLFNISPGNWNFRAFIEGSNIKLSIDTAGSLYQGRAAINGHLSGQLNKLVLSLPGSMILIRKQPTKIITFL